MDIHKPNPFHNWREFLSEITVIVTGIVIALGLDQAVELVHEQSVSHEAHDAILAEVDQNMGYMLGRQQTQACIARRLDEIGDLLEKAGVGEVTPRPNWIGQPSTWLIATQRWQAATGAGRTSLLDQDEQGRFARMYTLVTRFNDAEQREQDAWAQLRALETWRGPLGDAGRVHFVSALQQARYELWEISLTIQIARDSARDLGLKNLHPTVQAGRDIPHAVCLPITTSRDDALRVLKDNDFGQPK